MEIMENQCESDMRLDLLQCIKKVVNLSWY